MPPPIQIRSIEGRRDLSRFVRFPWKVYQGDPNWVPPLISERLDRLDAEKNPFFEHAQVELYLAEREGQIVGTLAAFVDHLQNKRRNEKVAGFGFFETLEDYAVAEKLLHTVCQQARRWGMEVLRGPTNFGPNDEPGVLIAGADCPPAVLEAHTPPYYRDFLERFGMRKYKDNYAWRVSLEALRENPDSIPGQVIKVFDAVKARGGVTIRSMRPEAWEEEVALAHHLFNATLEDLPDHVHMPGATFRRFAEQMRPLLDEDLALFAEVEDETVGFLIAIPDINRVLIHLNGRLFPLGWLKMVWYSRRIDVISFKLFGILRPHRRRGIDVLLYLQAVRAAAEKGYLWLDGSLTSDMNPRVVRLAERMGAERYKHYRTYEMAC
jgi:GNAT superfamily N-acetyltransferase